MALLGHFARERSEGGLEGRGGGKWRWRGAGRRKREGMPFLRRLLRALGAPLRRPLEPLLWAAAVMSAKDLWVRALWLQANRRRVLSSGFRVLGLGFRV